MIKRILFVIGVIPVVFLTMLQLPYETIKWVITGKEWSDPIIIKYFKL